MARKKVINIHAMNATKTKYDKPMTAWDFLKLSLMPGAYMAFLSYIILYRPLVSLIFLIAGMFYGMAVMIPKKIQIDYERQSLRMRNRLMGNIAQTINRENATMLDILSDVAKNRLQGELQDQIYQLTGRLGGSEAERTRAYMKILEAYPEDPIFGQFIEHLLTIDLNGRANTDALDDTVAIHNRMVANQELFISQKFIKVMYYGINTLFGLGLVFGFQFLGGQVMLKDFSKYIDGFAHTLPGIVSGSLFIAVTLRYNHKAVVTFTDENLMEV